ncbi:hypothetical protein [Oscillatoria acuminata]|nr:hypothetical protein [Oscillatoria acuminata]
MSDSDRKGLVRFEQMGMRSRSHSLRKFTQNLHSQAGDRPFCGRFT